MNILYCGDEKTIDGLLISILSLIKNVPEPLNIYIITMSLETDKKKFYALPSHYEDFLDNTVKRHSEESFVKFIDITDMYKSEMPKVNIETRFTPYCMLRLFADKISDIPDKILYLDNDVICRRDCTEFYNQDNEKLELIGVLDYYGSWFFRNNIFKRDYLNSGVLLLNLKLIRHTGLFEKSRCMCAEKKMFMPDQSALNKLAVFKKIVPRCYNEQRKLKSDTVLQHFTTGFRFLPWIHTITVKPWNIKEMHNKLKLYEYDDILEEYTRLIEKIK